MKLIIVVFGELNGLEETIWTCIARFDKIMDKPIETRTIRHCGELEILLEKRMKIVTMIVSRDLTKEDKKSLFRIYRARKQNFSILGRDLEDLTSEIPEHQVGCWERPSTEVLMRAIRNSLPEEHKTIRIEYFRNLLMSVKEILDANFGGSLEARAVSTVTTPNFKQGNLVLSSFFGDGLKGTILLGYDDGICRTIAERMLGNPQASEEDIADVASELSNQIGGLFRNRMSDIGIKLKPMVYLTLSSASFEHQGYEPGTAVIFPFRFGKHEIVVTLNYNSYRAELVSQDTFTHSVGDRRSIDVRLVNLVTDQVRNLIFKYLPPGFKRIGVTNQSNQFANSNSIFFGSILEASGSFLIGFEMSTDVIQVIGNKVVKEGEKVTSEVLQTYGMTTLKALLDQIKLWLFSRDHMAQFVSQTGFVEVSQGFYYLLRGPGLHSVQTFSNGGSAFRVFFSMDSTVLDKRFNVQRLISKHTILDPESE